MKPKDPELYSHDVDWLLNCAAAALGFRGTTGSVIACIERGGATGSNDHEHVTDEQLGWHNHLVSAPARYRTLVRVWSSTPGWARGVLEVHYATRSSWPRGVQGQLGQLAGVALALVEGDELSRLLRACEAGRQRDLRPVLAAAEKAVRTAHRAFYDGQRVGAEEWAA
jgi:hypothetical protein